jgi:hypothetical protein
VLDGYLLNLIFENFSKIKFGNFKFCKYLLQITGTVQEDVSIFFIISRLILHTMRNISDKSSRQNRNAHFVFGNFFSENLFLYEFMLRNMVEPDNPSKTI